MNICYREKTLFILSNRSILRIASIALYHISSNIYTHFIFSVLQFNNLKANQRKEPCIKVNKVNIRELNEVLSTVYLSTYTN